MVIETSYDNYVEDVIKILDVKNPQSLIISLNKYLPTEHDDVKFPQIRVREGNIFDASPEDILHEEFEPTEVREWSEEREVVHDAFFDATDSLMWNISHIKKYKEKDMLEEYLLYFIHSILDPFLHHKDEAGIHELLAERLRALAARAEANLGTEK